MVIKETDNYVEDEEANDGDNLCGYGGLYLPVKGWRDELAKWSFSPEVKEAIEKSIKAGIARLKENKYGGGYSEKVMKKMMEEIEE